MAGRYEPLRTPRESSRELHQAGHPAARVCQLPLLPTSGPGCRTVLVATLALGGACALAALLAASLSGGQATGAPATAGLVDRLETKFGIPDVADVGHRFVGAFFRGNDPFRFQCPLPGPLAALDGAPGLESYLEALNGTEIDEEPFEKPFDPVAGASAAPKATAPAPAGGDLGDRPMLWRDLTEVRDGDCCKEYDRLGWPFQFPECRDVVACSTCFKETGLGGLAKHRVSGLGGVAWAATVAVREKKKKTSISDSISSGISDFIEERFGSDSMDQPQLSNAVRDQRMKGMLAMGLREQDDTDLCPKIGDWEVQMLNLEEENINARVFKSTSKRLAVVAFRGTQADSMKNWEVDADIARVQLKLTGNVSSPDGKPITSTLVHEGFLTALERVLPLVKDWVSRGGPSNLRSEPVPKDWTLVFTGHSMGGALAVLAATLAEVQGWSRRPDAVIAFGMPRVADGQLGAWWKARGLCPRLMRVNTYNDVIHWMPFLRGSSLWQSGMSLLGCLTDIKSCLKQAPSAGEGDAAFSRKWHHVCVESEVLIPSALKGVNGDLEEKSPIGGLLAHFAANCRFGYGYGVMHGGIAELDAHCGIGPAMCPSLKR